MKLTNVAGQVISDDGIDDDQIVGTSVSVNQSRQMSQEEKNDLLILAKRLFADD